MIKPFLILQLRPEDEAADNEFEAILKFGKLHIDDVRRVRMEQQPMPALNLDDYSGVIVGGGPSDTSDSPEKQNPAQQRFEPELFRLFEAMTARDFPYLGTCYGLGVFAKYLGSKVSKEKYGEAVGAVTITLSEEAKSEPLAADLPANFRAFVGHKEACQDVPPGAVLLASSATCPVQMIRYRQNMYATQFHTELDAPGLILRINVYRHAGYFPPEDADKLIDTVQKEEVIVPEIILKRFVARYSTPV